MVGTSTVEPSARWNGASAVASSENCDAHAAFRYTAFTSIARVSSVMAPSLSRSGIRSRVASATQALMASRLPVGSSTKSVVRTPAP
jgi:hypothetical protein